MFLITINWYVNYLSFDWQYERQAVTMLPRYKQHCKTTQREEAEPVQASGWRYRGDSLEPKPTANCSLKLVQK